MPEVDLEGEIYEETPPTTVEISSTNVNVFLINYEIEHTHGEAVATFDGEFIKPIENFITLIPGLVIEVWRYYPETGTSKKIFKGTVEKVDKAGGKYIVHGKDQLYNTVTKRVNKVYTSGDAFAGKISAIFEDLVETYGGLTASVQDSGTTIVLNKFVCRSTSVFDRLKALAAVLDWQFYYRADTDLVYFEPKGYSTNTNSLTVGSEIVRVPKWKENASELINDFFLYGSFQEVEYTETETGTGTTTTFALDYVPISTKVYIDNVLKQGSVEGTTDYDYYVNQSAKEIVFIAAPDLNAAIEIRYSYAQPTPVHKQNPASQATYGKRSKTYTWSDVKRTDDAETRAQKIIDRFKDPFIYSTLAVRTVTADDIRVGQDIQVIDSANGVNGWFPINRHVISFPSGYDEIYVGEREWREEEWNTTIEDKIKRLEEQNMGEEDIIIESIEGGKPVRFRRKQLIVYTQTTTGGWFWNLSDWNGGDQWNGAATTLTEAVNTTYY